MLLLLPNYYGQLGYTYSKTVWKPTDVAAHAVEIFDTIVESGTCTSQSIVDAIEKYTTTHCAEMLINREKFINKGKVDALMRQVDASASSTIVHDIESIKERISVVETQTLKELYADLKSKQTTLALLQGIDLAPYNDIANMFPAVQIISSAASDSLMQIDLRITTPLVHFVEDDLKAIIKGGRVDSYNALSDAHKALLNDIFINKTIKLIIEQEVRFKDVLRPEPYPTRRTDCPMLNVGMPNPHHQRYDCWGDYKVPISRALKQMDIYGAIMLVKNAVAGINLLDAPVFREFTNYIRNTVIPCLMVAETNESITILEYCVRFEKQKAEELKKEQEAAAMKMAEPVVEETPIAEAEVTVDTQPTPPPTRRRRRTEPLDAVPNHVIPDEPTPVAAEPTVLPVIG